jgi:hypothetical protein
MEADSDRQLMMSMRRDPSISDRLSKVTQLRVDSSSSGGSGSELDLEDDDVAAEAPQPKWQTMSVARSPQFEMERREYAAELKALAAPRSVAPPPSASARTPPTLLRSPPRPGAPFDTWTTGARPLS